MEVLYFWATWCGPCKMLSPVVTKLIESNPDVTFKKLSVDDEYEEAEKYSVRSVPTLIFLKDNQVVNRVVGAKTEEQLQDLLNQLK